MKESHAAYIGTLLQGEEDGHCRGIKKRMDPTTRYRLQQQQQKYKLIQQERIGRIKVAKEERDKIKQME